MGGAEVAEGTEILNQANIPTFDYPDTAARTFNYMWRYQRRLQSLYETPHLPSGFDESTFKRFLAGEMIAKSACSRAYAAHRTRIETHLEAYGIPVVEALLAESADEAVASAEQIGLSGGR